MVKMVRSHANDADVILGYIPVDYFLGGRLELKSDAAKNIIEEKIAKLSA